jgi:hypothetical protein
MRLDGFNPIEREMSGLGMDISKSSLNLTSSDISLAQQQGHAAVDLYRIWWEKYDKMTRGDTGAEGWGRMKEGDGDKMSSTFLLCLVALVFLIAFVLVVVCTTCKRRRSAKLSASRLSLPPPYEMVVEEKERLAIATGLPSYKEACPNAS